MSQTHEHKRTSVFLLNYHFVWIPRRRRKVLTGNIKLRLEELLHQKAPELGLTILNLTIQPDHVHLFVSAPPGLAPDQIMFRLKGYTSLILRMEFPAILTKLPSLWTRSYFVSTAGNVSSATIQRYIESQSKRA